MPTDATTLASHQRCGNDDVARVRHFAAEFCGRLYLACERSLEASSHSPMSLHPSTPHNLQASSTPSARVPYCNRTTEPRIGPTSSFHYREWLSQLPIRFGRRPQIRP